MNKSESKYFATAVKMDEAFLRLLERKDFSYITVKEICAAAGVNRSTFYLHYETISDLLTESVEHMNRQFLDHMSQSSENFVRKIHTCPMQKLYLITPEYLAPYLDYVKEHKRLFRTAIDHAALLGMEDTYSRMFCHVFTPILERFGVREQDRSYMMAFYIRGLMAIITEWLRGDCSDSKEHIMDVMYRCVRHPREET